MGCAVGQMGDSGAARTDAVICALDHPVFASMGQILFRRAESDGAPVMLVPLGDKLAALPLRSLQREFKITDESADGKMLGLIAESLDYVPGLRPGDPLPSEVLSGEASWEPAELYRKRARGRLRLQLLGWIAPDQEQTATPDGIVAAMEDDRDLRDLVQRAVAEVASALGLPGADAAMELITTMAHELSYVEALRDSLLGGMQGVQGHLRALSQAPRGGAARIESLGQTSRLCHNAVLQTAQRFDEIDAQTGEIMSALRNHESQRAFIRRNRDMLYRIQRAWAPLLEAWDAVVEEQKDSGRFSMTEPVWRVVVRSYQFLAPRYLSFTEWHSALAARPGRAGGLTNAMMW